MKLQSRTIVILSIISFAALGLSTTAYAQPDEEIDNNDEQEVEVEIEDNDEVEVEVDADVIDDGYIKVGPILGYQLDADDHGIDAFRVGVDSRFALAVHERFNLVANPVVQITPSQLGDIFGFDTAVNFLVEPDLVDGVRLYGGPGLPLLLNFEDEVDTVTLGLNAIGGAAFDLDAVFEPFVQVRYHRIDISDGPDIWIGELGVHF